MNSKTVPVRMPDGDIDQKKGAQACCILLRSIYKVICLYGTSLRRNLLPYFCYWATAFTTFKTSCGWDENKQNKRNQDAWSGRPHGWTLSLMVDWLKWNNRAPGTMSGSRGGLDISGVLVVSKSCSLWEGLKGREMTRMALEQLWKKSLVQSTTNFQVVHWGKAKQRRRKKTVFVNLTLYLCG